MSNKRSTFAPDFAPTASEQNNRAKLQKLSNAENQPLTKKMQKSYLKIWSVQKKAVPLQSISR